MLQCFMQTMKQVSVACSTTSGARMLIDLQLGKNIMGPPLSDWEHRGSYIPRRRRGSFTMGSWQSVMAVSAVLTVVAIQ